MATRTIGFVVPFPDPEMSTPPGFPKVRMSAARYGNFFEISRFQYMMNSLPYIPVHPKRTSRLCEEDSIIAQIFRPSVDLNGANKIVVYRSGLKAMRTGKSTFGANGVGMP